MPRPGTGAPDGRGTWRLKRTRGGAGAPRPPTVAPLLWLLSFTRQRRIAYRGDWTRAVRRGAWLGLLVAVFVVMRVNGIFQPQILLFFAALALVAEVTLSRQS